ncbi:MAG: AraC family transcriptional regulator [Proteobacteria bacterium]|nr:AraC family transcriptional regulator [Pseudomonadota bacterium]
MQKLPIMNRRPYCPGSRATVGIGFVTGMLSGFDRTGSSTDGVLREVEIAKSQLHNPEAHIALPRYAALYRRVSEALADEGFALFSRPLKPGSFEFLCRAVLSAPTLGEALERTARGLGLLLDDLAVQVEADEDSARLVIAQVRSLPVNEAGRVFAFEWLLRLIHGLAAWLVARPLALDSVIFPYPRPTHAADYARIFSPHCDFGGTQLEARFARHLLDLPLRRDEAALQAYLQEAPASITTLYQGDRALALHVRDALKAALPEIRPLPDLARALFMSPRTLHRRLEEEGSSYRAIRDGLRRDLAVEWLTKSERPLQQIAAELGFADAAAFYRAFSAWTGVGPRAYRLRERG